jgi:gp16 family phage-associated protein
MPLVDTEIALHRNCLLPARRFHFPLIGNKSFQLIFSGMSFYISTEGSTTPTMFQISQDALERVRDGFILRGESVAEWARHQGYSTTLVYQVLSGRCKAMRGDSHRVAVALGLKPQPETNRAPAGQRAEEIAM